MSKRKPKPAVPTCRFCGRSYGVTFAIFNPRFPPFGTACTDCEEELLPCAVLPPPTPATPEAKP